MFLYGGPLSTVANVILSYSFPAPRIVKAQSSMSTILVQQFRAILGNGSNIIFLSSLGARAAVGTLSAYASTKGAINTLVKYFATMLGSRGIRVNAVAPGVIDTDMSHFTKTEEGRTTVIGMQTLKRIGQPNDVASVVAFLASDDARWITGDTIPVDGGSRL